MSDFCYTPRPDVTYSNGTNAGRFVLTITDSTVPVYVEPGKWIPHPPPIDPWWFGR